MEQQGDDQVAPQNAAIASQMVLSTELEDMVAVRKPAKPEVDTALVKEVYTTIREQYNINNDLLDRVRNQKRIKREFPPGKEGSPGTSEDATFKPTLFQLSNLFQKLFDITSELKAETLGEEQQRDSGISVRSSGTSLGRGSQHEDARGSQHEGGRWSQYEDAKGSQHEGGRWSQYEDVRGSQYEDARGSQHEDGRWSQYEDVRGSQHEGGRWSQYEDVRGSQHEGGRGSQHEGGRGSQHEGGRWSQHEGGRGSQHEGGRWSQHEGGRWSQHEGGRWSQHEGGRWSQHEGGRGSQHEGGRGSQHEGGRGSKDEGGRISQNEEQPSCLKATKEPRPLSDMMAINQGNVSRKNRLGRSRTFDNNDHPDDKEVQKAEVSASGGDSMEQPRTLSDVTATELLISSDAMGDNPADCPIGCLNQTAYRETKLESTVVKTNEDVGGARDTSSTSEPVENEDQSPSDTSSESSE